jgi:hypothetical protein
MSAHSTPVIYKDIPGHPGYRAGDDGSVWSRWGQRGLGAGLGTAPVLTNRWRLLRVKPRKRDGYLVVTLRSGVPGKKGQPYFVHRLVLGAFVGPCPPGLMCCHFDGSPANNRLDNLRWDTQLSNGSDAVRHGRSRRWGLHHNAKLTAEQVAEIKRLLRQGVSRVAIADRFPASLSAISHIARDSTWGYVPWPDPEGQSWPMKR